MSSHAQREVQQTLQHFLDGIARSRLGSIFPKLVGFSLDSDESQASQTPLFSTRASRSIPDPEYIVALLSPLELIYQNFLQIQSVFGVAELRYYKCDQGMFWLTDLPRLRAIEMI